MSVRPGQGGDLSPVKRALVEVRELRAKLDRIERREREPIAIIGIGCRFPGDVRGVEDYWRLLRDGVDAIVEVPADRWDIDAYYDPDPDAPGKMSTRYGGFMDQVDLFDAGFFGISDREAAEMDPQQRVLLEVAWEALENAGHDPRGLKDSATGVFIGIGGFDYARMQARVGLHDVDAYMATGASHSVASGRLSYVLGLRGPCMSVDTACSASLVAIHSAVQSLRVGESRMALAGGVNIVLLPDFGVGLSKAKMMAADGRCKAFDARADGFVRSDGCGIVVLKRMSDALADGDAIYALVRGTAVNQDGNSNGLTAPSGPAQEAVIREALERAGVSADDIGYVEAHGTGTSLGDPIEARALSAVLCTGDRRTEPLAIGSVKTNLGHLETAAGVAGFIKAALMLQRETVPPHLHLEELNPYVDWQSLGLDVPAAGRPWPRATGSRFAGVSSFGFSGTNAHVVLEEAPVREETADGPERPLHLFCLSARDDKPLRELAGRHAQWLEQDPASALADICFTAGTGRAHFSHRLAMPADSVDGLRERLQAVAAGKLPDDVRHGVVDGSDPTPVAFVFSGQGSQYPDMGRRLFETQPTFRRELERCNELVAPFLDRPLLEVMYPSDPGTSPIMEAAYAQPAILALEYALASMWRSWGVEPGLVYGHSLGEYAAACVAGVLRVEDAMEIVARRARLMQALPENGGMAAAFAPHELVEEAVAKRAGSLAVAAVNGSEEMVISGAADALRLACEEIDSAGYKTTPLKVTRAFHSPLIDPMLAEFADVFDGVDFKPPRIDVISNVTGEPVQPDTLCRREYWCDHARRPVQFENSTVAAYELGYRVFVEIGPSPTLSLLGATCAGGEAATWLPSLRPEIDDWKQLLSTLGALYASGAEVNWTGFDRDYGRRRVSLPTYAFDRRRYWLKDVAGPVEPDEGRPERWTAVTRDAARQGQEVPIDLALHSYPRKWDCLERLSIAAIVESLRALGVYTTAGESHTVDALMERCEVVRTYRHLVSRWLETLANKGLLEREAGHYRARRPLAQGTTASLMAEAREVLADIPFLLEYQQHCARLIPAVLRGEESPLETLFPGGSSATARAMYHDWAVSRYYNGIARAAVAALVSNSAPGRALRILEIGAGTGGTTAAILPVLPPARSTYHFTDVSEFFFGEAAGVFDAYPFVRYELLDIERDPREQGFANHDFDVVIAANVLHATRSLEATLGHVRSLLAPEGILVLYETTEHLAWTDVTVGLIEGWQLFEDDLRKDNPLLSSRLWAEVLAEAGFDAVAAFPEEGSPAEVLPGHVLIAREPATMADEERREAPAAARSWTRLPSAGERGPNGDGVSLAKLSAAARSERTEMLEDFVRGRVMRVLGRDTSRPIDTRHRLMDLGIDSLMAMEVRNSLAVGLRLDTKLPATLVFDHPTVEAIARYLLDEVLDLEGAAATIAVPAVVAADRADTDPATLDGLNDDEVAELLEKKLEEL